MLKPKNYLIFKETFKSHQKIIKTQKQNNFKKTKTVRKITLGQFPVMSPPEKNSFLFHYQASTVSFDAAYPLIGVMDSE